MIKIIKNDQDYQQTLKQVEELVALDPPAGSEQSDLLKVLVFLVSKWEEERYYMPLPDPIVAIKFRMEQQGLKSKDLIPILGSKSRVSEILNRKRSLTLKMIRALHRELGIPAHVLLGEPTGPHKVIRKVS